MPNSRWGDTGSDCAVGRRCPEKLRILDLFAMRALPIVSRCLFALHRRSQMYRNHAFFGGILAAGCFVAASVVAPSIGYAQADMRVTKSMGSLKGMAATLGAPKLEGNEAVGGKDAPALYFGTTKINNNFDIVDAVGKEDGQGMTATLFAKGGD